MASIRRRRDRKGTRWIVDGRDIPGGSRITVRTKEEAELRRAEMVKQGQQAQPTAADRNITVDGYADRWLAEIAASVDPNTLRSYRENLARYVRPLFGPMKLRELHRGHIRALLAKKRSDGLKPNSVRLLRGVLSVMLGDAVEDHLLQTNPAATAGRRRRTRPDTVRPIDRQASIKTMDYAQLATFLACVDTRCAQRERVLLLCLADTGLRPGEACGVQWADFDAVARTLHVRRAVTNDGRVKGPKTGAGRTVDLSARLTAALTVFQAALEAEALVAGRDHVAPWVFAIPARSARPQGGGTHGAPGTPSRPYHVGRLFDRLIRAAHLPHFRLYDLRHTFASHLIASGATVDYVSTMLGHASMAMTLTVYAHHFPKGDRQFIDRMAQVRAATPPAPTPVADDATVPLTLEALTDLNAGSWPRYGTAPVQPAESVEMGALGGISAGYHRARRAIARRPASSPPSR